MVSPLFLSLFNGYSIRVVELFWIFTSVTKGSQKITITIKHLGTMIPVVSYYYTTKFSVDGNAIWLLQVS